MADPKIRVKSKPKPPLAKKPKLFAEETNVPQVIPPPRSADFAGGENITRTISGNTVTRSSPKVILSSVQASQLQDEKRKSKILLVLAAALFMMAGSLFIYQVSRFGSQKTAMKSAEYQLQLAKRVEHHKNQTGFRLNIERSKAEADNFLHAPEVAAVAQELPSTDVMAGLALVPEPHHRESSRDRSIPLNANYADADVQYQLKIMQENQDYNEAARENYIKNFVQNAKKNGYEVVVKDNLDVIIKGRPKAGGRSINSVLGEPAPVDGAGGLGQ